MKWVYFNTEKKKHVMHHHGLGQNVFFGKSAIEVRNRKKTEFSTDEKKPILGDQKKKEKKRNTWISQCICVAKLLSLTNLVKYGFDNILPIIGSGPCYKVPPRPSTLFRHLSNSCIRTPQNQINS